MDILDILDILDKKYKHKCLATIQKRSMFYQRGSWYRWIMLDRSKNGLWGAPQHQQVNLLTHYFLKQNNLNTNYTVHFIAHILLAATPPHVWAGFSAGYISMTNQLTESGNWYLLDKTMISHIHFLIYKLLIFILLITCFQALKDQLAVSDAISLLVQITVSVTALSCG